MKRRVVTACLIICAVITAGCGAGTEQAAKGYFDEEFNKWVAGEESAFSTLSSARYLPPMSYSIRNIVAFKPELSELPIGFMSSSPEDFDSWPCYRLSVVAEFESKAGTPLEKVLTYTLIWDPHQEEWILHEQR